jgi:hypothetical protein
MILFPDISELFLFVLQHSKFVKDQVKRQLFPMMLVRIQKNPKKKLLNFAIINQEMQH